MDNVDIERLTDKLCVIARSENEADTLTLSRDECRAMVDALGILPRLQASMILGKNSKPLSVTIAADVSAHRLQTALLSQSMTLWMRSDNGGYEIRRMMEMAS